jgi:signal transduction histidine kinase
LAVWQLPYGARYIRTFTTLRLHDLLYTEDRTVRGSPPLSPSAATCAVRALSADVSTADDPFAGAGETRALARAVEWSATSLGPVDEWPDALRTTVRTALDSPFPMNLWCGSELVLIYNDAYRHVLGIKHPRAFCRPGREVWAEIWDEIAPMFDRIRAGGPPVYADDAPFIIEREASAATGEAGREPNAWFTFSLSPVRDDSGEIVAFLNVVSESTARLHAEAAREAARAKAERAEARLRDVFAQAPAFMAVLRGRDHVFEYVNAAYYQLVGHRPLVGRPVSEAIPEIRGQGFEEILDVVLDRGEPFVGREVPVLIARTANSEPEQRFLDFVYYPLKEADGLPSGIVAHGSDVTDHVLARREAQRARAAAEQANQAKSHFLAMMSHEIRTPINAVIGYADLLDTGVAGVLTPQQHQYVQRIRISSSHLLTLVNDVLDLAKIEAGEMSADVVATTAADVVAPVLDMVAAQAEAAGVSLERAWECSPAARFTGDPARVRQILLNLLSNALKFTDPGGRVTVRCRVEDRAPAETLLPETAPWVVLDVEDTGVGIPTDQLPRIFEPFVQAEGGHTRRAAGTGLGLTISRRLARLMGGELTVRSSEGAGSCFSLWFAPPAQESLPEPEGPRGWEGADDARVDPAGLAAVGHILLELADQVEDEMVERLRGDVRLGRAGRLSSPELADHMAAFVSVIARSLATLGERGEEASTLRESEVVQDILAARHGRQRLRIGWTRDDLRREYHLLHDHIDGFLRRTAPGRTAADFSGALALVHRLLARAEAASLAAYDGDAAGDAAEEPADEDSRDAV